MNFLPSRATLHFLAATTLLAVAATAQTTRIHRSVFTGVGNPSSAVQGVTNLLGSFSGTGSIVGQTPTGDLLGVFNWGGANSLSGSFQLTLGMMLSPGVFLFTEQVQVTGGSGLYANATGTEFAVGGINLATSQFAGVGRGVVTY